MMAAAAANAFVYPFALPFYAVTWPIASAVLFVLGFAATGWLVARAAGVSYVRSLRPKTTAAVSARIRKA
jgi:uncharacterized integral membrane protein